MMHVRLVAYEKVHILGGADVSVRSYGKPTNQSVADARLRERLGRAARCVEDAIGYDPFEEGEVR
ncbi:MAG: hypothetical protein ACREJ3_00400 [Polyangiaceae bacterium]